MTAKLRIRMFAHSWVSDWNHGNAHFLRGLARALVRAGHSVRCYEQLGSWSLSNLIQQEGDRAIQSIDQFRQTYPELDVRFYNNNSRLSDVLLEELRGSDVVIVHEWNDPVVVNTVLSLKKQLGFRVLFHDTHHRAYSNPREILRFQMHLFDGVLAFGEAVRRIYSDGFGIERTWTFHEAADVDVFRPITEVQKDVDLIWIGNWGDEERAQELEEFLIAPAASMKDRKIVVHGVRYPERARRRLQDAGIEFGGYLPNIESPYTYAKSALVLHVPRRQYANGLSGIPTIRVFESLACGVALLCAPWADAEGLFRPKQDYLCTPDGDAMKVEIERLLKDDDARAQLARNGLETVRRRHTCAHRAAELIEICGELGR